MIDDLNAGDIKIFYRDAIKNCRRVLILQVVITRAEGFICNDSRLST